MSTHLFSLAVKEEFPGKENEVSTALRALLRENAIALLTETRFKEQPFAAHTDDEKYNVVGRANLFIFLFELYWVLSDNSNLPLLISYQREFVFLMQLGDDLGDWREDFRASRWTSFLRECFGVLGRIPTEQELEEFVRCLRAPSRPSNKRLFANRRCVLSRWSERSGLIYFD